MPAKDRILVIGANGMLGHDLMDVLSEGREVIGADIGEIDIRDGERALNFILDLRPKAVVNAAARTDVDGCESDVEDAFAVNARGASNIAKACASAGARMVQVSTDYVFDGRSARPYREDDRCNPQSIYGKSKRAGEEEVRDNLRDYLIVRTSWLFGSHGKNFVDTILRAASRKNSLDVVGDQRGSPTYSRDLAVAISRLLDTGYSGVVHAANSGSCSWYEYALAVLDMAGVSNVTVTRITSDRLSRPAPRPAFSALDCGLYERLTSSGMRPWREAVGDYIQKRGRSVSSSGRGRR